MKKSAVNKFISKAIIAIVAIPLLTALSFFILPVLLSIRFVLQIHHSYKHSELLDLASYYLTRLIGHEATNFFKKNKLPRILLFPFKLFKELIIRIVFFIIGGRIIIAINNKLVVFKDTAPKQVSVSKKILAVIYSVLHLLSWPLELPRRVVGILLYTCIFPAQFRPKSFCKKNPENFLPKFSQGEYRCRTYFVKTPDRCHLQTYELAANANSGKEPTETPYIIRFCGLLNPARTVDATVCYASDFKKMPNIIIFNLRGVDLSTGIASSAIELVHDGIAQVNALLAKGVKPENIVLDGFSLGAGIATKVAEYFKENFGYDLGLINDRSFYKIGAFLCYPRPTCENPDGLVNLEEHTPGKAKANSKNDKPNFLIDVVCKKIFDWYLDYITDAEIRNKTIKQRVTARKEVENRPLAMTMRKVLKWLGLEIHAGKAIIKLDPKAVIVIDGLLDFVISPVQSVACYLEEKQGQEATISTYKQKARHVASRENDANEEAHQADCAQPSISIVANHCERMFVR